MESLPNWQAKQSYNENELLSGTFNVSGIVLGTSIIVSFPLTFSTISKVGKSDTEFTKQKSTPVIWKSYLGHIISRIFF